MRILMVLAVFVMGYLIGCTGPRLGAQDGYYYGSDGSGYLHEPVPGGPRYWYGSDGTSGVFLPSPGSGSYYGKSPC